MTAAGLTLAFAGLAGLLALVVERPLVSQMANAGAFSSVGWMTLQLRRRAHVLQPALGAGGTVFVFGVLQILLIPALRQGNALSQLWVSVLLSTACAFSLAWLGALLASGGRNNMPALRAAGAGDRWQARRRGRRPEPASASGPSALTPAGSVAHAPEQHGERPCAHTVRSQYV